MNSVLWRGPTYFVIVFFPSEEILREWEDGAGKRGGPSETKEDDIKISDLVQCYLPIWNRRSKKVISKLVELRYKSAVQNGKAIIQPL
jgi:hypothetical protein